eukprot:SAG31_NODE_12644_length_927_cov_1.437198_3_plen_120_part_01
MRMPWHAVPVRPPVRGLLRLRLLQPVRVVTFSFLCPLLEKCGTFIARCNALIEKVPSFRWTGRTARDCDYAGLESRCGCYGDALRWTYDALQTRCTNGTTWMPECAHTENDMVCRNNMDW